MRKPPLDVSRFNDISRLPVAASVGGHRAEFLYCGVLGGTWWRNFLHAHSFFETCHVYAGCGTFRIDDKRHRIARGDTFIAWPGGAHEIISSRSQPLGIYFWGYTLIPQVTEEAGDPTLREVLRRFPSARVPVARIPSIGPLLRMMTEEMTARAPGYFEMLNLLATKVMIETARAVSPGLMEGEPVPQRTRSVAEALVRTAEHYLRDNLERSFRVRDIAAQVNLSERQLTRVFRRFTGSSILAYLTNLRIERASQLLLHTDLPIKQVASDVGFPDTHYFTTLFGRRTGMTPGAFRQKGGTAFFAPARGDAGSNEGPRNGAGRVRRRRGDGRITNNLV